MPESNAWLLNVDGHHPVAIGEHELLHIITEPELHYIPKTKKHCQHIISWQNHILPVTNISGYVHNENRKLSNIIGIIAYKNFDSEDIKYSAIDLTSIPKKIKVNDNQQCQLTDELKPWEPYTISCFKHENNVTPIINLVAFFQKQPKH